LNGLVSGIGAVLALLRDALALRTLEKGFRKFAGTALEAIRAATATLETFTSSVASGFFAEVPPLKGLIDLPRPFTFTWGSGDGCGSMN
jgi:hypothetical protein